MEDVQVLCYGWLSKRSRGLKKCFVLIFLWLVGELRKGKMNEKIAGFFWVPEMEIQRHIFI
jgi:hypothetical protein